MTRDTLLRRLTALADRLDALKMDLREFLPASAPELDRAVSVSVSLHDLLADLRREEREDESD